MTRARRAAVLCALALLCAACMVPIGTMPPGEPAAPPPPVELRQLVANVVAEANRARTSRGAPALEVEPSIERAAREYAEELAARRTLSHESPTPGRETLGGRLQAVRVTYRLAGENLASMRGRNLNVPAQTIRMWLDSPGHRANLLNDRFTHTGVGVASDAFGAWYVVQVYVLPMAQR